MDRKGLCEEGLDDSGIGEFVDGVTNAVQGILALIDYKVNCKAVTNEDEVEEKSLICFRTFTF